jgi:hypothetical protein
VVFEIFLSLEKVLIIKKEEEEEYYAKKYVREAR